MVRRLAASHRREELCANLAQSLSLRLEVLGRLLSAASCKDGRVLEQEHDVLARRACTSARYPDILASLLCLSRCLSSLLKPVVDQRILQSKCAPVRDWPSVEMHVVDRRQRGSAQRRTAKVQGLCS